MLGQGRTMKVVGISKDHVPPVDRVKLTVLAEDSVSPERPDLVAKHGLSFLVETSVAGVGFRILMDAGPTPDIALQNARTTGVDIKQLDAMVICHGHYDHARGLLEILRHIGRAILVVAHPLVFSPKFTLNPNLRFIGPGFDQASVATGGILLLARNPIRIASGVITSGEVTRQTSFEKPEGFWKVEDERFVEDPIIDEQALVVNVRDKGLVVITGCGHSGIINTLKHVKKTSGTDEVYTIVGGFHLARASDNIIQATVDELSSMDPRWVHPCHCTGSKATHRLLDSLGDGCRPIQTGDVIAL